MSRFTRLPALDAGDYIGGRLLPNAAEAVAMVSPTWCDAATWQDRFEILNPMFLGLIGADDPQPARNALLILVTGLLEELGETSVRTIEAAALYSISIHPQWRAAARHFLQSVDPVALDGWLNDHPAFVSFGAAVAAMFAGDFDAGRA